MKSLIVIAHPDKKAIEHINILPTIKLTYKKKGYQVDVIDLYKDGYNPSQFIGDITNINKNAFAKSYKNSIKLADHIWIISPTRWLALNILVEGFIDQVFTRGFAFKQGTPLLKRKKLVVVTTSTSNKSLKWKTFNLLWIRLRLLIFPKIFSFYNVKIVQLWNIKGMSKLQLNKSIKRILKIVDTLTKV